MQIKIITIFLLINFCISAQEGNKEIAKIGKTSVNENEFIERFELTPRLGPQNEKTVESAKRDFLYTIIAEKLWALKAKELNLDTMEVIRSTMRILERMYIRDELYKLEVTDKVIISDQALIQATFRNQVKLKVDYLWSGNKDRIDNLYNLMNHGLSFDSLLTEKDSIMEITFGQLDEAVEDSLYKLRPGEYTAPIQAPNGEWFIFRVINRENKIPNPEETEKENQNVRKIVKQRITNKIYGDFYVNFFRDKKVNANGPLLYSFAEKVIKILSGKKKNGSIPDSDKIYINENDVVKIKDEFGSDSLRLPLIRFKEDPVSLEQFLDEFSFQGFYTTSTDSIRLIQKINSWVRNFIEHEFLTREGYKRGLQNLPGIKSELNMWDDYYLSQMLRRKFLDSAKVTDNEVFDYYKKQNKEILIPKQVNIIEVLTDSLEVIEKVLDGLKNGQDMRVLAKMYTQREWTKDKGGEFGYFPVTQYGDIGRIAGLMNIGEVYGPLKVPEGFSIFKLIGKKDEKKEEPKPFEDVKDKVKDDLRAAKLEKSVIDYTVKLANKYGVSVNEDVLKSIKTTYIVMFAYRYMGFGGRIVAVPMVPPFSEWVKPWLKSNKNLP